jgi:hypothetical protein
MISLVLTISSAAAALAPVELQDAVPASPPRPQFESRPLVVDVGGQPTPITTVCGSPEKNYILEVNGGGLVLGDFDGDGSTDLVVVDGSTLDRVRAGEPGLPPRLLLNDGQGNFRLAGEEWALAGGRWGMGGAAGDVDGDGHLDLLVTEWGPDRLFRNLGGRGFEEITDRAGLVGSGWSSSAAFLDYDRDGHLDLVVIGYLAARLEDLDSGTIAGRDSGRCKWKGHPVMCGPEGLTPLHDRLYRGRGDGTFVEVSRDVGFRVEDAGFGLGVTTVDYDGDGDTDLYVSNDSTPNHLWENRGDGTFEEVGSRRNVAFDMNGKEQAGMGIAVADLNEDGFADLFVTNFSGENNSLYLSRAARGGPAYAERSSQLRLGGPSIPFLGWGTAFGDFDLDTDQDLFVLNGHVYPEADQPGTDSSYAQEDHLYRNGGELRFEREVLHGAPLRVSRAGASADLDGDGDLDLVALELGGAVHVLENRGARGHWLTVRARGAGGNTQALGARLEARHGDRVQRAELRTAGGFQAAVPAEAHFGFGDLERLPELVIHWPSGRRTTLRDVALDRILTVHESSFGALRRAWLGAALERAAAASAESER